MKKTLLILGLLIGLYSQSFTQIYNYTAYSFNWKYKNESRDYWYDWQGWTTCDIDIIINANDNKVKIFSEKYQEYKILIFQGNETTIEGDEISAFYCVDLRGTTCRIRLVSRQSGSSEIYIDYNDMKWVYSVISIQ